MTGSETKRALTAHLIWAMLIPIYALAFTTGVICHGCAVYFRIGRSLNADVFAIVFPDEGGDRV